MRKTHVQPQATTTVKTLVLTTLTLGVVVTALSVGSMSLQDGQDGSLTIASSTEEQVSVSSVAFCIIPQLKPRQWNSHPGGDKW